MPHIPAPSPVSPPPPSGQVAGTPAGRLAAALYLAAVVGYGMWFFRQPLDELPPRSDGPWTRGRLAELWLVPEAWFGTWFGEGPATVSTFAAALSERLAIWGLAGVVLAAAWGLGECVVGVIVPRCALGPLALSRGERVTFNLGVGLALVSLGTLGWGLAGLLAYRVLAWGLVLVAIVGCGWLAWRRRAIAEITLRSSAPSTRAERHSTNGDTTAPSVSRWWWLAGLPFVVALVWGSTQPPVDFDVREYHLQAPKEFYQAGRITFLPHNVYANMPLGAELPALAAMVLADDWWRGALAGKVLIAVPALLAAVSLVALGRRLGSPRAGVWGAVIYLSTPWIVRLSIAGLIDAAVGGFFLLACHATVIAWQGWQASSQRQGAEVAPDRNVLLLAGFLAGSAAACKYPALLFVVVPLGVGIAVGWARRPEVESSPPGTRFRHGLAALGWFAAGAIVACGPWLMKNSVLTGNPVYPLLYSWFDGATRTDELDARWVAAHAPHGFGFAELSRAAWSLAGGSPWLGPLLVPGVFAAWGCRAARGWLAAGGLLVAWVVATWWLATHRIDRFWIPVVPLAAGLAGWGWDALAARLPRGLVAGLVALGCAASLPAATLSGPGVDARLAVPLSELRRDPARLAPWHAWLNEHVAPEGAILAVGDAEVFDLERPVVYATAFDPAPFELWARGRASDELGEELTARGITHVYVHWGEIARYRSRGNYGYTPYVMPERFDDLVAAGVLVEVERWGELADRGALFASDTGSASNSGSDGAAPLARVVVYRVGGGRD